MEGGKFHSPVADTLDIVDHILQWGSILVHKQNYKIPFRQLLLQVLVPCRSSQQTVVRKPWTVTKSFINTGTLVIPNKTLPGTTMGHPTKSATPLGPTVARNTPAVVS